VRSQDIAGRRRRLPVGPGIIGGDDIGERPVMVPVVFEPSGPAAEDIGVLWWLLLVVGTAVFLLVVVLLVVPMIRRRTTAADDRGADRADVPPSTASRWIVGLGVLMPTVLLVGVLVATVWTTRRISGAAPAGAVRIEVEAYQFWWSARYLDGDVTVANEIHIPAGEPVALTLTSADVIHSFWVPELHGKLDMLPDGPNTLVLEADEPGEYLGACAEFCGLQHAGMNFLVIAQPRAEFDAWLAAQREPAEEPAGEAARRGREVFAAEGCAGCHEVVGGPTVSGPREAGPDLTHVGSRRTLAADTIANTAEQMTEWLRDPDEVKEGTTMPAPELTDDEISDLVAYLQGLE
jgi:cytochrome c oxidase subunit 2